MEILVINVGSSSLKYQLIDMSDNHVIAKGLCERIGIDGRMTYQPAGKDKIKYDVKFANHADAIEEMLNALTDEEHGVIKSVSDIAAVGHRIVHGGEYFFESTLVDEIVLLRLEELCEIAPLHNPGAVNGIHACIELMGSKIPQVVVFDTAFHQTMPDYAYMYALPYELYEGLSIRKYGFHGTSHKYVAEKAAEYMGKPLSQLKMITCHLGSGASIAAIKNGKSIDTSMGFTPLDGLPMGTRCGSIDASIIPYIMKKRGISQEELSSYLNKKSGMLGVTGVSSDFRDICEEAERGNERCSLALQMFAYSVRKFIGSYLVVMEGLDVIVLTAGIGENSAHTRSIIFRGLEFLGIDLDHEKNITPGEVEISADNSKIKILLIPTNEELAIAIDTEKIVSKLNK